MIYISITNPKLARRRVNTIKEGDMISHQRKEQMISYREERRTYQIQGKRKERCEGDTCNSDQDF
jgi:hypothetical protein